MKTDKTQGVFYVATGQVFLDETWVSLKSLKAHMPDCHVTLYTDLDITPAKVGQIGFDQVIKIENPCYSFNDKVDPILNPPYDKSVFLDTDTVVMDGFNELFEVLDHFDFAYCHASCRAWHTYDYDVPIAFAEANSGVLVYNRCPQVRDMMEEWVRLYDMQLKEYGIKSPDQPPLRAALYRAKELKKLVLPPEYNLRVAFPCFAGGGLPVKIVHGRGGPLFLAKRKVNKSSIPRVFSFYRDSFLFRIFYKLRGKKNI